MAEYRLTLSSDEDYRLIKKLLKAFDGASIIPSNTQKPHIEVAMDEVRAGKIVGSFNSVQDFMADLLS